MTKKFKQLNHEINQSNQHIINKVKHIQQNIPMYQNEYFNMLNNMNNMHINTNKTYKVHQQLISQQKHIEAITKTNLKNISHKIIKIMHKLQKSNIFTNNEKNILQQQIIMHGKLLEEAIKSSRQVALFPIKNELNILNIYIK